MSAWTGPKKPEQAKPEINRAAEERLDLKPEDPITKEWLDECFVRCRTAENGADDKLADTLFGRLQANAIFTLAQLQHLSHHGDLHKILECQGVADVIDEHFDRLQSKLQTTTRRKSFLQFFFSLAGNLDSMISVCVHYGLVSALILTMTFSNFGSIQLQDWQAFMPLALRESHCQNLATDCPAEFLSENHLGWGKLYCHQALDMLIKNPATNLTAIGAGCCIDVLGCASLYTWKIELAFVIGCGGGSAALLLVVLFASWLYITLHATKANPERDEEQQVLASRLRQEFRA
jgi:hypothetical protein